MCSLCCPAGSASAWVRRSISGNAAYRRVPGRNGPAHKPRLIVGQVAPAVHPLECMTDGAGEAMTRPQAVAQPTALWRVAPYDRLLRGLALGMVLIAVIGAL